MREGTPPDIELILAGCCMAMGGLEDLQKRRELTPPEATMLDNLRKTIAEYTREGNA